MWFCTTYSEASIKVNQPGEDDDDVPGDCGLIGGAAGGGQDRNPAREAKRQRDYLKDYFNNEGAVAWQHGRTNYNSPFQANPMPNITCSDGQTDKPHAKHNLFRRTNRQTPCQT